MQIFNEIESKYRKFIEESAKQIEEQKNKIVSAENGLAKANQYIANLQCNLATLEQKQSDVITADAENSDLDAATEDILHLRIKIDSIERNVKNVEGNLAGLKRDLDTLYLDRAGKCRDIIADYYGEAQSQAVKLAEELHTLCVTWAQFPEVLAEKYSVKYGKSIGVQDPVQPIGLGGYGKPIKDIIEGHALWEQEHLGVNRVNRS